MISRLRLLTKPATAVAARPVQVTHLHSVTKGRHFRAIKTPATAPAVPPQTATPTPPPTPPKAPTDWMKMARTGFTVVLTVMFFSRMATDPNNPDSMLNRVLNPRGKSKYQLKIERLDETIDNYNVTFVGATKGVKAALQSQRRASLNKQIGAELESISDEQLDALLKVAAKLRKDIDKVDAALELEKDKQILLIREQHAKDEKERAKSEKDAATAAADGKTESVKPTEKPTQPSQSTQSTEKTTHTPTPLEASLAETMRLLHVKLAVELAMVKAVEGVLDASQKSRLLLNKKSDVVAQLKDSLLGLDGNARGLLIDRLANMAVYPANKKKRVFVLKFNGDTRASQVEKLREEITAVLSLCDASRGDSVVLKLDSGGGTVTGYGLGAAQLLRLRDASLPLTVCVDEVAASGGYLMACVADRIVASPFAVLGSVGVVATIPNVSERLTREGIAVEDVTAGKYKRTLTPYKKATKEDRDKVKSEVENVLTLFKSFVHKYRPQLNIDEIATGETWHGPEALSRGLVDELRTADDVLLEARREGAEVFSLSMKRAQPSLFADDNGNEMSLSQSLALRVQNWLVSCVQGAVSAVLSDSLGVAGVSETSSESSAEAIAQRVMAIDVNQRPRL